MKIEVACHQAWHSGGMDFYVLDRTFNGVGAVGLPIAMKAFEESMARDSPPPGPTFSLDRIACQSLMDALYASGIRPAEAMHANEALAASREHIADLRKVAFGLMDHVVAK